MDSNSSTGATKRFDGAGEDATRRYWKWEKMVQKPIIHSSRPRALQRRRMVVLSSVYWMDPPELALEGLNIEELSVVNGADRLFSCLDERFGTLRHTTRLANQWDDVFRLKVDKGERTAAYTGWCRAL